MADSSIILPAILLTAVLCALHARADVYGAFVRGVKEGLTTLLNMAPYLCAIFMAVALLRASGLLEWLEAVCSPVLSALGMPPETAGVVLIRPLSASAALGMAKDVMDTLGPDSRAARICAVICAASETVFFTGSLYMGAAGVKKSRYAIPAALLAYFAGIAAAGILTV